MTQLRRKPEVDYYKVLQVDAEAEPEVIEAAYRALSKKYHPDLNRATDAMDRMASINSAYTVLNDPSKRRDYNYLRSQHRMASVAPATPAATPGNGYTTTVSVKPNATSSSSSFNPSTSQPPPKSEPAPKATASPNNGSFRPQGTYPSSSTGTANNETRNAPASTARSGPSFRRQSQPPSRAGLLLLAFFVLAALAVGGVLAAENLFGNPLGTSFLRQAPAAPVAAVRGPAATAAPPRTTQPALPLNREQVLNFLNTPDYYANRLTDAGLTASDTVQLRLKLASSGGVLNADNPPTDRAADELNVLRQSEATSYNLIYSLFARFQDLNRLNLILTDAKDTPVYRADVTRYAAYTFYPWHASFQANDQAEARKAAQQDRLVLHFGAPLDDSIRLRLNAPTEANIQTELQNMGLSAFSVTGTSPVTVNYFQVRSEAEMAVDFARIIYSLYTRFPALDKLQIVLSTTPEKSTKTIDRQTFSQIGLESWSQASYGGAATGGDRQAQSLIAALPGKLADLRPLALTTQGKFKTPIQVSSWAVVTESVERYENLVLEGLKLSAGKDRQFLVVRVALRNVSDGRQWLMPGERMSLVDTRGPVYAADPAATLLYVLKTPPSADPPPGPVEPNKQGAVYAAFNVPLNVNLATLRLQFIDGDKKVQLELV